MPADASTADQLAMFSAEDAPTVVARAAWVRTPGFDRSGKLGAIHEHESGWRVEHCGHPTANTPWAVYSPTGALTVSPTGLAYQRLAHAKDAVESMLAGRSVVTSMWDGPDPGPMPYDRIAPRCSRCRRAALAVHHEVRNLCFRCFSSVEPTP